MKKIISIVSALIICTFMLIPVSALAAPICADDNTCSTCTIVSQKQDCNSLLKQLLDKLLAKKACGNPCTPSNGECVNPTEKPAATPCPSEKPAETEAPSEKPSVTPSPSEKPQPSQQPSQEVPTVKPTPSAPQTSAPTSTPDTTPSQGVTSEEQAMVNMVNQERAKAGLAPLAIDMSLTNVAREKSRDMIRNNYFSHTSPTYGSPFDMMKQFGISYTAAAENIAKYNSVEGAHVGLMNSSGHRANILNGTYTHIGIGIIYSNGYYTITQMFIRK